MDRNPRSYLIIEPDQEDASLLTSMLTKLGATPDLVIAVDRISSGLNHPRNFDFVFWELDANLNEKTLAELRRGQPEAVIFAIVEEDNVQLATEALSLGVSDYLVKGEFNVKSLFKTLVLGKERRELQLELEKSEARFRGLIEQSYEGVIISDLDYNIVYAGPSVESITGYQPSELMGQHVERFIHPEDFEEHGPIMSKLSGGEVDRVTFKERVSTKKGEYRWIETRITDCRNIRGINGFVANFRDIHEQEEANRARRHAEEKNNVLIESTSDGVWQWNVETDSVFWSDSIYKMLGYALNSRLADLTIVDIAHPDDKEILKEKLPEQARRGRPFNDEIRVLKADGTPLWVHLQGSGLRDALGNLSLVIGTLRNIDHRKRAEKALFESRAMLRNLTDNVAGGVTRHLVLRQGGFEVVFLNKGTQEVLGISNEDVFAEPEIVWSHIVAEDRKKLNDTFLSSLKTMEPFDLTFRFKPPEAAVKFLHARGVLHPVDKDRVMVDSIIMDITPLKNAEEELAEREALLKNIMGNIDGAVQRYCFKPDGSEVVLYLSEGHTKITGLSMAELYKDINRLWEMVDPIDLKKLEQLTAEATREVRPWSMVWRMTDAKGNEKWIQGNGVPEVREDGSLEWDQILIDITQLKETEIEVRRLNERFQMAVSAARMGLWEYDLQTGAVTWDETTKEMFGVTDEEFNGSYSDWTSRLYPADRARADAEVRMIIKSKKEEYTTHFRIIDQRTGRTKYIRTAGRIVEDDNGEQVKLIGLNWDVTYMQVAQKKLAESNRRYELASQATSDAIWDWDPQTNTAKWSRGLFNVFGHPPEEAKGKTDFWDKLVHPDDHDAVMSKFEAFLAGTSTSWEDNYRMQRADGSYAEVLDRGIMVRDENGEPRRMVGAIRDFTERGKFIRALEAQNKKLKNIAWTQSHELRSPLSRILGLLEMVQEGGPERLENRETIKYLIDSARELDSVVHRIVNLTREIDLAEIEKPTGETEYE